MDTLALIARRTRPGDIVISFAVLALAGALVGSAGAGAQLSTPCSKATARQLVDHHHLNGFLLPNPVHQLLCGAFTGRGSTAMAVTIGAPTCWGVQRWAVFDFTRGKWRLVLDEVAFIFRLDAIGTDIRETAPVFRKGDPRCAPSGGKHARIWHWNGTRFTAGPWTSRAS